MQLNHKIKSISTSTPTQVTFEDSVQSANTLVVQNINDKGFIYLGSNNVSSTNYGYRIYPGQGFTIEISAFTRVYAVASDTDMSVAVMVLERAI